MHGPSPDDKHPMQGFPQVCFIKNTVKSPNIVIGDYTYYDDPDDSEGFERNVLYHFPFICDKLIIRNCCAVGSGVRSTLNGANHELPAVSTLPSPFFCGGWEKVMPALGELPYMGDTIVGSDVWLGYESLVMPGVKIGNG